MTWENLQEDILEEFASSSSAARDLRMWTEESYLLRKAEIDRAAQKAWRERVGIAKSREYQERRKKALSENPDLVSRMHESKRRSDAKRNADEARRAKRLAYNREWQKKYYHERGGKEIMRSKYVASRNGSRQVQAL